MKFPPDMELIDETAVKRVAHVVGELSAAKKALDDAEAMRARGSNPAFGYSKRHSCYIVFDVGHV